MKKNKGITLIALVITIIILLILAGISIVMIFGENGLILRSKESAFKTNVSQVIEQVELEKTKQIAYDYEKKEYNIEVNELSLGKDIKEAHASKLYIDKNAKTWYLEEIVVDELERKWYEDLGIKPYDPTKMSYLVEKGDIKIGDYVNYVPDTMGSGVVTEIANMFTTDPNYSLNNSFDFMQDLSIRWRVYDVTENGEVLLISQYTPKIMTSGKWTLMLSGPWSYNNIVYVYNYMCEKFYSKEGVGVARNISIEDIENVLVNFDKNNYVSTGRN